MTPKTFSRREIVRILEVEESLILLLEDEQIISMEPGSESLYSPRAFERIRVASTLINELEVNIAGVDIIVRMREQINALRSQFEETLDLIHDAAVNAERRRNRR